MVSQWAQKKHWTKSSTLLQGGNKNTLNNQEKGTFSDKGHL